MVDMAIGRWGNWVEQHSAMRDDDGNEVYPLELLLADPDEARKLRYGTGEDLIGVLDVFGEDDD